MNKKAIFSNPLKKITGLALTAFVTVGLASCNASDRNPYGKVNLNETYATATVNGQALTVKNKEVYDSIRYSTLDYFVNKVDEAVLASEITKIKEDKTVYKDKFNELILKAIFDKDTVEGVNKLTLKEKNTCIAKYVDTMAQKGVTVTAQYINDEFSRLNDDETVLAFETLHDQYMVEVAKYAAACDKLDKEIAKKADYYSDSDIITYWDTYYKNTGDVNALMIKFVSTDEVTKLLTKFGIKAYDGKWYQIKLGDEAANLTTETKYNKYYSDYTLPNQANGDTPIASKANGNATVLKVFAEIYNFIYSYREPITYTGRVDYETWKAANPTVPSSLSYYKYIESIINADVELVQDDTTDDKSVAKAAADLLYSEISAQNGSKFTKEELDNVSTSLTTYVYTTLQNEAEAAKAENDTYTQYSATYRTYSSAYYLVFKIDAAPVTEVYETTKDADGNETKTLLTTDEAKTVIDEIKAKIRKDKLTSTYISNTYEERCDDAKLKIYDSALELNFLYSSSSTSNYKDNYSKTKTSDNSLLGKVKVNKKWVNITVDDAWADLEPIYGPQAASNLLLNKFIETTDEYAKLEDQLDSYKKSIENMLYYFANGYYSSYGYDASMGKYNFMKMYYGSAKLSEAVNSLRVSSAKSQYFYNVTDNLVDNFLDYAKLAHDSYYSLSATHVLVYADIDDDGNPDEDYFATHAEAKAKAQDLITEVVNYVKNSSDDYATAISNAISEYNSTLRIESTNPTSSEYRWAAYRKMGLQIKSADLSEITNSDTTNEDTIVNRISELYTTNGVIMPAVGFSSAVLDANTLETKDGLNILLVTAGSLATSAKYDDEKKLYSSIPVLVNNEIKYINLDYTSTDLTKAEVEVYVREYFYNGSSTSLPSQVESAITAYLTPVVERYTSSASTAVMTGKILGTITFTNNNTERQAFLANGVEISKKSLDEYSDKPIFANWWTNMYN